MPEGGGWVGLGTLLGVSSGTCSRLVRQHPTAANRLGLAAVGCWWGLSAYLPGVWSGVGLACLMGVLVCGLPLCGQDDWTGALPTFQPVKFRVSPPLPKLPPGSSSFSLSAFRLVAEK